MPLTRGRGYRPSSELDAGGAGRRDFLVAGFSGAAGLGMVAAGWALARWPDVVIGSVNRIVQAMGGRPDSLGATAGQRRGDAGSAAGSAAGGAAGGVEGGTRP